MVGRSGSALLHQDSQDRANPLCPKKHLAVLNFDGAGENDFCWTGQGDVADFVALPIKIDL